MADGDVSSMLGNKISPVVRSGSCISCIRYLLIMGNCFSFFLGCTIIGLGIYVVVDKVNTGVTGVFGLNLVAPASYMIIASGCFMFIISFLGFFGALFESRPLLVIYSTCLSIVLILSFVGFLFSILFRSKANDQIKFYMRETLRADYGTNLDVEWNLFLTESWDKAQTRWQCCAVEDDTWSLYLESMWFVRNSKGYNPAVPLSCCKLNEGEVGDFAECQRNYTTYKKPDKDSAKFINAINIRGCYEEGKKVMKEISGYLICIGIITAILVAGGIFLALLLARSI